MKLNFKIFTLYILHEGVQVSAFRYFNQQDWEGESKMSLSKVSDVTDETLEHHFHEWCRQKYGQKFSLLITGKTGVGKSSLVNALIGMPGAEEGDDKVPSTDEVTSYVVHIEGVIIRM